MIALQDPFPSIGPREQWIDCGEAVCVSDCDKEEEVVHEEIRERYPEYLIIMTVQDEPQQRVKMKRARDAILWFGCPAPAVGADCIGRRRHIYMRTLNARRLGR